MDYTEQTEELFKKLPFLDLKEIAKIAEMDYPNFHKHATGQRKTTEKMYMRILEALRKAKELMP